MDARIHCELAQFMKQHGLDDSTGNIDDIVLSYLTGVVELASQGDDAADFEDVLDMMNAYLPGFENINRADVIEWMFGLSDKLTQTEDADRVGDSCDQQIDIERDKIEEISNEDTTDPKLTPQRQSSFPNYDYDNPRRHSTHKALNGFYHAKMTEEKTESKVKEIHISNNENPKQKSTQPQSPAITKIEAHHPVSSFINKKNHSKRKGRQLSCSSQESQEDTSNIIEETDFPDNEPRICALLEMFPAACTMEARHCLRLSSGDMDQAAQLIIDRQETGQAIAAGGAVTTKKVGQRSKKLDNYRLDDDTIKLSVLQKYSFVDTEEDKKTYRPPPPKKDTKKLVRYRDGQVVSMKGERFSEIKKSNEAKS